jgi:hypothetical protein
MIAHIKTIRVLLAVACLLVGRQADAMGVVVHDSYAKEALRHATAQSPPSYSCGLTPISVRYEENSPYEHFTARSGIDFDTTYIPDSARILNVTLEVTVLYGSYNGTRVHIKPVPQPVSSFDQRWKCLSLFATIGGQARYITENQAFWGSPGKKQIDLGPVAAMDLQSRLSDDWFAVGLQLEFESYDTQDAVILEGLGGSKLQVTYVSEGVGFALGPGALSNSIELVRAEPNPFATHTTIRYDVPPPGGDSRSGTVATASGGGPPPAPTSADSMRRERCRRKR